MVCLNKIKEVLSTIIFRNSIDLKVMTVEVG